MTDVDEDRADQLSNMPKVIDEDWRWRYKQRKDKYEAEAKVKCISENTTLSLVGWINRRKSYSYSLIYKGSIPIRRWGGHPCHKNPDGEHIQSAHKHKWRQDVGTSYAYETDDVSTSNVDQAFFDFLDEESIEFNGTHFKFEDSRIDDWL